MSSFVVVFGSALILSMVLTYRVRRWATLRGWVDRPDGERRLHDWPVPRVGGVAVYATVVLVAAVGLWLGGHGWRFADGRPAPFLALLGGSAAIFAIGLWDDVRGLRARVKFALEIAVAVGMYLAGVRLHAIGIAAGQQWVLPEAVSFALSTLWLVGVTNAFNLIDGSDGVAAGAALFASGSMALVSIVTGNALGATTALTLAGAALGFLFFNFPPATIFLGDSGSLTIGFLLAALGLVNTQAASTSLAVAIPVISLGLPILDTLLAMARRTIRGEPVFNPDRGHIHHRLRDLGHSPRKVALLLYAACAGFGLLSLLIFNPYGSATATIFIVAGVIVILGVQRLRIPELLELRRLLERGLMQRYVIASNVRIREATRRLQGANRAPGVFGALTHAFDGGAFERVELRMAPELALCVDAPGALQPAEDGWLWSWESETARDCGTPDLELRFALRDPDGTAVGELSLWHSLEAQQVLPDPRLIHEELGPEVVRALRGLATPGLPLRAPIPVASRVAQAPARRSWAAGRAVRPL